MKKKLKFFGLIFALVLAAASMLACGGDEKKVPTTNKLNLDDYVLDINQSYYGQDLASSYGMVNSALEIGEYTVNSTHGNYGILVDKEGLHNLYDTVNNQFLLTGKTSISVPSTTLATFFYTREVIDGASHYALYDTTGRALIENVAASGGFVFNTVYYYMPNEFAATKVLEVIYTVGESGFTRCFYLDYDADFDVEPRIAEISRSELRASSDGTVGDNYSMGDREYLYPRSVGGSLDTVYGDYTYVNSAEALSGTAFLGNPLDLTVYDDESVEVATIKLDKGAVLGAIGNYLYYYELEILSPEAKKYNVYLMLGESSFESLKINYTLYRLDLSNGKTKEYDAGYMITEIATQCLNYKTHRYDAAQVVGCKFVDGVANMGALTSMQHYFVDSDLKMRFDLTNKDIVINTLYKLTDNRYLTSIRFNNVTAQIVDSNLEPIVYFDKIQGINAAAERLLVVTSDGRSLAIDYDGRVIVDGFYGNSMLTFYGDSAIARKTDDVGNVIGDVIVDKDGNEVYVKDRIGSSDDITITCAHNLGYFYTLDQGVFVYYNSAGDNVLQLINVTTVGVRNCGGFRLVTLYITTNGASVTFLLKY